MEFGRERVDSDCESLDWAANVQGKVVEDRRHFDRNLDTEGAVSSECGQSDESVQGTCEGQPADFEELQSDTHVGEPMSEWTISLGSSSEVRQGADGVLGTSGDTTSGHSSHADERTTANAGGGERGGSESLTRGGQVFHEEEEEPPPPSTVVRDNSLANASEDGDKRGRNHGGNTPNDTRLNSTNVNGGFRVPTVIHTSQKVPSGLLELSGRLSESLGMAVATVFHEVFERNGDFGASDTPVDELSGLLEAALKESLVLVLGNERGDFLERFRNSFRSNYQTMRSVRRAFEKSGGRLTPSRQIYPHSRKVSQEKPNRVSPSQSYRGKAKKNVDDAHNLHTRKHLLVENAGVTKNSVVARYPQHTLELYSEEEISSFNPTRFDEPGHRVDLLCGSDKSCLNESLQSAFFTDSTLEQEACSDTAGSCSKTCLNESLESSFFTSSNPEKDRQEVSTRSCSLNTLSESFESQLSGPVPNAKDVLSEHSDTEGSWDVDMFSATSSTESDDWMAVDRDDTISSAHHQNQSAILEITLDAWTSKERARKVHHHSERVVEYAVNSLPVRCSVGESKQRKRPVGFSDSKGRCVSGDSIQYDKTVGSCDSSGKCLSEDSMRLGKPLKAAHSPVKGVVGISLQDTKSVGSSDKLGNHNYNSLQAKTFPRTSRSSSGRVDAINSVGHPGDRLVRGGRSQGMTLGASAEIGERSSGTEPIMNPQRSVREADSFGGLHMAEESSEIMFQRRRGHVTQLTGPLLEGNALVEVDPYFNYGVRASSQVLLERLVEAQEIQNHLKSLEIAHNKMILNVQMDHLQIQSESNVLMKETVDVSRSRIDLKEFELEDRKLSAALCELRQMCADELVAGLFVMFSALAYSAWKFSYTQLSRVVTTCQLPIREPRKGSWLGTDWMANTMEAVTYRMQILTCEVTKAGRMVAGLTLIAIVTTSLLSRSVTSNSQTMPATILIIFLAGICGLAGKFSIDSLGGNGYVWLLHWWLLCFLHLFATSCTSWLYKYLYGPASKFYQTRTSLWMKSCSICVRFSFHIFLVLVLPLMAGLLPFASLDELNRAFWELWENDIIPGPP